MIISKSKTYLVLAALLVAAPLRAQMGQAPNTPPPNPNPGANPNSTLDPNKTTNPVPETPAAVAPPSKEQNAFKSFVAIPDTDLDKKVKASDDFVRKFPKSVFVPRVYSVMTVTYIQNNQPDKGIAAGEKAISLDPNDTRTMANLAQTLARLNNPNDPQSAQKLQQAEQYAQKCIEITPTLKKPDYLNDQDFANSNKVTLSMAHSALGTINVRRGDDAKAIADLQEAARLDDGKDGTNFYLLGVANSNTSHFSEAVDAYGKCAASTTVAPALQKACQDGAAEAKKQVK
jgi:tetratricopeptide (TPR) repeat protein